MRSGAYPKSMRVIDALANAFINTFGITQPTEEARRRASRFIMALVIVALGLVALVGFLLYQLLHR